MKEVMTKVIWLNRHGERREHSLVQCTEAYARDWWRRSILECQGILSVDERRNSRLVKIHELAANVDDIETISQGYHQRKVVWKDDEAADKAA